MQNDMRDRLVELMNFVQCKAECCSALDGGRCGDLDNLDRCQIETIADHLIANGVVVPPCKVGDTVYCIYNNKVTQGTVRLIRPFISKEEIIFKGNIIGEFDSLFYDDGRKEEFELYVVFEKPYGCERVAYLTKDQAEQKLKELSDNAESYRMYI